jgi:hypothetical protein
VFRSDHHQSGTTGRDRRALRFDLRRDSDPSIESAAGGAGHVPSSDDDRRQVAAIDATCRRPVVLGSRGLAAAQATTTPFPWQLHVALETFTDALEITHRLLTQDAPVTFVGKQLSVSDAVLLPRPRRRMPILIGGNGEKRTLPLAAKYADEWNGVYLDVAAYKSRNVLLDGLLEKAGRDPRSVKRSLMCPFAWAQSSEASAPRSVCRCHCERFMLQFMDYDRLEPPKPGQRSISAFHG